MSDNNEKIASFIGITGASEERARFFLESAAWDLDMAMASFFDEDDGPVTESNPTEAAPQRPAAGTRPAPTQQHTPSRFATIGSLHQEEGSDSDGEEGEAFYAGGSERGGGQQILGPPKKKNADKLVQDMFKAAQEHGAQTVEGSSAAEQPRGHPTFKGSAYRLGDTEGESQRFAGASTQSQPRQVDVVLKMWKNGFSVDDGPLRPYEGPENREFLNSIKQGEVPRELIRNARGGEVNLSMEDQRHEDYVKPKVTTKPFGGEGMRLGSPAGGSVDPPTSASSLPTSMPTVSIDSSKPATSLQIRLADGTRLVAKFNHSHTVADVRSHIINCHPQFAAANFVLMTTFPNKELTQESQSLAEANLINAVLVQRMK